MEFNLKEIANGAVQELFENDLNKILDNIQDPNTSLKKGRKLTINFTFKPLGEDRDMVTVEIDTKSVLAPVEGISTQILIDKNGSKLNAVEFNKDAMKGQMVIEDLKQEEKIVNFKYN